MILRGPLSVRLAKVARRPPSPAKGGRLESFRALFSFDLPLSRGKVSRGAGRATDGGPRKIGPIQEDSGSQSSSRSMYARTAIVLALACAIGACTPQSAGEASGGFVTSSVARAYLPLDGSADLVLEAHGAATIVAAGIAATNAHNANLVASTDVIGASTDYDLLFFRRPGATVGPTGRPSVGEAVIAYGQGAKGELRQARGTVRDLSSPVEARCPQCPIQQVFTFTAPAGAGFSGGPVVDASDGRILGIVFGYNDLHDGSRLMYAYDMDRVGAELAKLSEAPAHSAAQRP